MTKQFACLSIIISSQTSQDMSLYPPASNININVEYRSLYLHNGTFSEGIQILLKLEVNLKPFFQVIIGHF